jgi:hypothetical protein
MLVLPKLLKLMHIRQASFTMRRFQLLLEVSFTFFIGRAALSLVQPKVMVSVDLAESAYNLPDPGLEGRWV